ncbi:MAG: hypothetical protein WCW33_01365 [Candidatus Babeliales bacterium]
MRRARITVFATFCIISCYLSSLNAMGGQGVSEATNTALFKGLTKDLQRTVARNATQQHMQNVASILQDHLQDASSAISTLWHIQTHKNKWFEGLAFNGDDEKELGEESSFIGGKERFFPEIKLLVDEFAKDKSDVVVLVIGPNIVHEQIAPEFIFDTLTKNFPQKSVSIFLIDPLYSQYPLKEGIIIEGSRHTKILLSEDFISALARQLKLPFNPTKKEITEKQVTFDGKIVVSNNNTINFTHETGFSNITLKLFATMIPIYYYHSFFGFLRAFFAQKAENKKIVFIGYFVDKNCYDTPSGLAHAYLDYKKLYPDNFFLYSWNAVYDPLERFKLLTYVRLSSGGIDRRTQINEAPVAQRFFTFTFRGVIYTKERKDFPFKDSPFIALLNHKSPFFFYAAPTYPLFTFEETSDQNLRVSYNGATAAKDSAIDSWGNYINYRERIIAAFPENLIAFYKKNNDEQTAKAKAHADVDLFGPAVKPEAEPTDFKDALIFPIKYEELL